VTQFVTHCYRVLRLPSDCSTRNHMQHRALGCVRRLVPALPERGARSDGVAVATRHHNHRTELMRARLLLAAIVLTAFTLSAQQQRGVAPSRATAAVARLSQVDARSASIDDKQDITPANVTSARILDRLRLALLLGVFDDEAGAAEDMGLLAGRVSPYPMPRSLARPVYAEPEGKVYPATRVIDKPGAPRGWQPTDSSGSGCWWLWVFTGVPFCS
jgi:hypothetical protein